MSSYVFVITEMVDVCRARDVATRKKFVALVDSVKYNNGDVKIFSSLHVSGERKFHIIESRGNETIT